MTATARLPEFDKKLTAYLPALRRLAKKMARHPDAAEELFSDTMVEMLHRHRECHLNTFWTWSKMIMVGAAHAFKVKRGRLKNQGFAVDLDALHGHGTPARQDVDADLTRAVGRLAAIPHGDIVLRRAMGDTLMDIGNERGTSREDIRQKEVRARNKLAKDMRWAA